jgi:hypothetical protein
MSEPTEATRTVDLAETLASAEGSILSARPSNAALAAAAVAGALGGALYGAAGFHHGSLGLIAGALIGAVGLPFFLYQAVKTRARRKQTDRYFSQFAGARGWTYEPPGSMPSRDTPLLQAGDAQTTGPGFALMIDSLPCRLYEHIKRVGSGKDEHFTHYVVLVVTVDLAGIGRLRLHPHAMAAGLGARLSGYRIVELESQEFEQAFDLEVDDATEETLVRQLFDPALITALLDFRAIACYLGDYTEWQYGRLVLAAEGTITLEDGAYLDTTVSGVAPLLARFAAFAAAHAPHPV